MAGGRAEKRKRDGEKKRPKEERGDDSDPDSDAFDSDDSDSDTPPTSTTTPRTTSSSSSSTPSSPAPLNSWLFNNTFKSIDHHWTDTNFATASDDSVEVWSEHRSNPIQSYTLWGSDSVNVVRYNPSEVKTSCKGRSDNYKADTQQ